MQSAKGRDCTYTTTLPKAWVTCDSKPRERGLLLATLQQKGYHDDKVSDVTGANRQWTEDLYQQKPDLLWIALHQPTTKQGSRADRRQQRKKWMLPKLKQMTVEPASLKDSVTTAVGNLKRYKA